MKHLLVKGFKYYLKGSVISHTVNKSAYLYRDYVQIERPPMSQWQSLQ